jgi:glycosyltransferase involved in cell wall biosynthesis
MTEINKIIEPFISVVVITYNSAETVIETLDSISSQGFFEMEVLICDDGSTDATLEIVLLWLKNNKNLFMRAQLLTSLENQGICKNIAKGYAAARGEWIKPIAGDDVLTPHAILKFASIAQTSLHDVIVCRIESFGPAQNQVDTVMPRISDLSVISGPADLLLKRIIRQNIIPAPGAMFRRSALYSIVGVDQHFKHLDDWPLWVGFLQSGKTFEVTEDVLVKYRQTKTSVSKSRLATNINKDFLLDLVLFYKKYQRHNLPPLQRWDRFLIITLYKLAAGPLRAHPTVYGAMQLIYFLSPLALRRVMSRYT